MPTDDVGRNAAPFLVMLGIAVAAIGLYFATGMPGMDHGSGTDMAEMRGHRLVDPASFSRLLDDPEVVTINVHVPAGEITLPGTELQVPFDALDGARLPADRQTTLAVYCKSGNMSAAAVEVLLADGYTDIVELRGGTEAWQTTEQG